MDYDYGHCHYGGKLEKVYRFGERWVIENVDGAVVGMCMLAVGRTEVEDAYVYIRLRVYFLEVDFGTIRLPCLYGSVQHGLHRVGRNWE